MLTRWDVTHQFSQQFCYCQFHFYSLSCERIDGIRLGFAYALMLTRSRFSGSLSMHYILVSEQGVSIKHCLLTFLVQPEMG